MERFSTKKIARAAVQLFEVYPRALVVQAVAQEMLEQRRGRDVESLGREIAAEVWRTQRHAAVTITSARALPAATMTEIGRLLKGWLKATTITVDSMVEPAIKGGAVVTTPVGTLDVSVQGRLNQLKKF